MKKFFIAVVVAVLLFVLGDFLYWRCSFYIDLAPHAPIVAESYIRDDAICGKNGEEIEIRGVNIGSSMPGTWAIDFATDRETYLRWFADIQALGANTIRVYTLMSDVFYDAFYEYNMGREEPLYLLQGVSIPDDILASRHDIYSDEFYHRFYKTSKMAVDVIHGVKKITEKEFAGIGYGTYRNDVSAWVLGYIFGTDWNSLTVAYANDVFSHEEDFATYHGEYLYTSADATAFEAMLASIGDAVLSYESRRYKEQRVFAFVNSADTDPFLHTEYIRKHFSKCACVDVEHILAKDAVVSGQFASYHVYPYYPDFINYYTEDEWGSLAIGERALYETNEGKINTYRAYLQLLENHHSMPLVIAEFGLPSSYGISQIDVNMGRDQGHLSEKEQGEAIVSCYEDIMSVGCAGGIVSSWQDEWYKSSRSTSETSIHDRSAYWTDECAPEQSMGLLAMEPAGKYGGVSVDGDISEWTDKDIIVRNEDGSSVSVRYDERYLYLCVQKSDFSLDEDILYLPIDVTPKSGSNYCENYGIKFDRAADFLLIIDGKEGTHLMVQERYEVLRAINSMIVYGFDTYVTDHIPDKDSPLFVEIDSLAQMESGENGAIFDHFEIGRLTFGNSDPESAEFDSLSHFFGGDGFLEIRLPWSLLNFCDPSLMRVHDDFYEIYGVDYLVINKLYVGLGEEGIDSRIAFSPMKLRPWGVDVQFRERLKESYYILQSAWTQD